MKEQKNNSAAVSELNTVPFKTKALPYCIVAPALIITIGIMIPFAMAIYYSLTNYSFRMPDYTMVWFKNWITILKSATFWKAIWVTARYAFFCIVLEMGLGMGIAIIAFTAIYYKKIISLCFFIYFLLLISSSSFLNNLSNVLALNCGTKIEVPPKY